MKMFVSVVAVWAIICGVTLAQEEEPVSILERLDIDFNGFLDVRAGSRLRTVPNQDSASLAEVRLQLELNRMGEFLTWEVKADFIYDDVMGTSSPDLETGKGNIDLRTANIMFSPTSIIDVRLGRQILTWGTGDLVFINDMFPKDWQSFFNGRDVEYLKAPSDALFFSIYPEWFDVNIVYTPRFDADRYISGERLSYWNPMMGDVAGQNAIAQDDVPDEWFHDDETTVRLSREIAGYELALYGYYGYWKSPMGFDMQSGKVTFPKLSVYGGSARTTIAGGVLNIEGGYYDSREDSGGDDAMMPNSEMRGLVGYEHEIARDFTMGLQYYLEVLQDYDAYMETLPEGSNARDEYRHLTTLRLTKFMLNQNLNLSMFMYYSPSDEDGYIRPVVKYKVTDQWLLTTGANIFFGKNDHTFFGQFEDNNNVYVGSRYSF
ncbi:MAG: hypothetical protein KAI74_05925 [Kiritimatiellae bacterium]|nr:hypothetical protein [Kiritimatiellia bacterium]